MNDRELILLGILGAVLALFWYSRTDSGSAVFSDLAGSVAGAFVNRGIRNNNPGNIRRVGIKWRGAFQSQSECEAAGRVWDPEFEVFFTMQDGERALGHQIATDLSRGQNTLRLIIAGDEWEGFKGYAPSSENDTEGYIAKLSQYLGVTDSDVLDDSMRPQLAQGIMLQETGFTESPDILAQAVYS